MKKLALVLAVLALFVAPAVAGTLTIVANPVSVPDGTPSTVKVEFWAEGFGAIGGIEVIPTFTLQGAGVDVSSLFSVKLDPLNGTFLDSELQGYDVKQGEAVQWLAIFGFVAPGDSTMVGFMGLSFDVDCTDPTLVMTINYDYSQLANGTYIIGLDPWSTGLTFSGGQVPDVQIVNGTFTVEVIPEPCTMALLGCGLVGLIGYGRKRIRK